jgi:hypothetical protein
MKNTLSLLLCIFLLLLMGGCASLSAEPVSARVVDKDTGEPIAGVVVVAYWGLHRGSFTGDALPCGAAGVEEAVTDQDGTFDIPGWGPISSSCDMMSSQPLLILFKPGYDPKAVNNPTYSIETVSVSRSVWNGKTLELPKYPDMDLRKATSPSYASEFGGLNNHLLNFIADYPGECYWKKVPNMLRALKAQQKLFNEAGNPIGSITSELVTVDQSMQQAAPQCGSPKAFVEGL